MTHEATIRQLHAMRLSTMADAYAHQMHDPAIQDLSFSERFSMIVDVEYRQRKDNRLKRLIQNAHFELPHAHIADVNYTSRRKLNRETVHRLAEGSYIDQHHNIIILGAAGLGKTYLACALGMAACHQFYKVRYIRLPDLLGDLAVARGEGIYRKVMKQQFQSPSLLIIDEWLLVSLTETESQDLLNLINSRHHRSSTIFCSQFSPQGWHGKFSQSPLADSILDRIVHDSYTVLLESADEEFSMRELYGINKV